MLPRHAYLSATMLALAATMSEEDSPVVPSPEPDDESHTELCRRDINAFTEHVLRDEPLRTGYAEIDAALTPAVGGSLNFMVGGAGSGRNMYKEYIERESVTLCKVAPNKWAALDRSDARPEQRANKKARGKRKAKKGWA